MAKKLKEEQSKAEDQAEAAAEESGTPSPVLQPEKSKMPEPGTTDDLDVVNTDDATSLNPNIVQSGTKPDGQGGQELLASVDPAVANAAILPRPVAVKPQSPSSAPEQSGPAPDSGQVLFKCTADNGPFYSGGEMKPGETYTMSREEAELLVSLKAGSIEGGGSAPPPPPSDNNARVEGADRSAAKRQAEE